MYTFTNSDLITVIKTKSAVPENNSDWSDQTILDLANEVVKDTLLPLIIKLREEYYVFPESVSVVSGTAKYRVNPRFIGSMYRDVQLVNGTQLISLPQISPEDVVSTATGTPSAFYMQGANLCLYPTPNASFTLNNTGYIRPSKLTELANCAKISAIDTVTFQITVDAIPSTWTAGTVVDFVKGTPGYEILSIDSSIVLASGYTITFSSLPSGLAIGDYVAPFGTTPIPNIPDELQSVLAEFTVAKILKSMGQNDEANIANQTASSLLDNVTSMLKPRIAGANKKFKTRLI